VIKQCPPLMQVLREVTDYRQARGKRYSLPAILGLACAALLCGYRSYSAMAEWGRNYGQELARVLEFDGPTPCAATLHAVFRHLDVGALEQKLGAWAESLLAMGEPNNDLEPIAIDGKTLRGSAKQGSGEAHLLSALSQRLGITLAQKAIDKKANEISALPELLEQLIVKGRVVTVDALHTQRKAAQTIIQRQADYVMPVKKNQLQLLEDIQTLFDNPEGFAHLMTAHQTLDLGHGRCEERRLTASTALVGYCNWPGLQQVFRIERVICTPRKGERRLEVVYGVTSLSPERANAEQLLALVRQHWYIENRSHWVRDVTFDEDRSQVRRGHIPEVMAGLRNAVISLIRIEGGQNIAAACRHYAAQPRKALALIGLQSDN
jgi:predicted transposase YbfD/YdcC